MDTENILKDNETLIKGEKREKFEKFRALLLEYNQKYNLTSITEESIDQKAPNFFAAFLTLHCSPSPSWMFPPSISQINAILQAMCL